jgi:hypothetical protein
MAFRKAQIEITPGHTVTVDAEDAERIQARTWKLYPGEHINTAQFYTDLGTPGRPAFQLLQGFIMGVSLSRFVELIDRSSAGLLDYRKRNLKVR